MVKRTGSLIDKNKRGDVGAISDAINRMYAILVINTETLNSFKLTTGKELLEISSKADANEAKITELASNVSDYKTELASLGQDKASKNDLSVLEGKFDELKETVLILSLPSQDLLKINRKSLLMSN